MTVQDYIKKYYKEGHNRSRKQKAAEYLQSRINDLAIDFGEESEEFVEYLNTELTNKSIENMERLCSEYYDTMLSSDCDYMINENYSYEELLELVETE